MNQDSPMCWDACAQGRSLSSPSRAAVQGGLSLQNRGNNSTCPEGLAWREMTMHHEQLEAVNTVATISSAV